MEIGKDDLIQTEEKKKGSLGVFYKLGCSETADEELLSTFIKHIYPPADGWAREKTRCCKKGLHKNYIKLYTNI